MNEMLSFVASAAMWLDLEMMLSYCSVTSYGRNWTNFLTNPVTKWEKDKYCMISLMCDRLIFKCKERRIKVDSKFYVNN